MLSKMLCFLPPKTKLFIIFLKNMKIENIVGKKKTSLPKKEVGNIRKHLFN